MSIKKTNKTKKWKSEDSWPKQQEPSFNVFYFIKQWTPWFLFKKQKMMKSGKGGEIENKLILSPIKGKPVQNWVDLFLEIEIRRKQIYWRGTKTICFNNCASLVSKSVIQLNFRNKTIFIHKFNNAKSLVQIQ